MKKNKQTVETRFAKVLEDLDLKQADVVRKLKEHNIPITSSSCSKFVNGKLNPTSDVIEGMEVVYGINPQYLKGTSSDMYGEKAVNLKTLSLLFPQIKYAISPIINKEKKHKKWLQVEMSSNLYNLLIQLDSIKKASEDEAIKFNEKLHDCIKNYYKKPKDKEKLCKYILIPEEDVKVIITNEERLNILDILKKTE